MPSKRDGRFLTSIRQLFAVVEMDIRKLHHDPTELFTRMLQPIIWILIFGEAMTKAATISTGSLSYLDFMVPGILAQSILLIAIFYGIALIWEKDMGSLHKVLSTPAPRVILVVGRSFAAGIRGLSQVVVVFLLAFILRIDLRLEFFSICCVLAMAILIGAVFSTFSLIVAALVKKRERFMGIGQAMIMPLFFASNALYPINIMPNWLKAISSINPLSYQVDALRSLMIAGQTSHFGLGVDFGVSLAVYVGLIAIATKLYPKILY